MSEQRPIANPTPKVVPICRGTSLKEYSEKIAEASPIDTCVMCRKSRSPFDPVFGGRSWRLEQTHDDRVTAPELTGRTKTLKIVKYLFRLLTSDL
jgi:hypothetical protein